MRRTALSALVLALVTAVIAPGAVQAQNTPAEPDNAGPLDSIMSSGAEAFPDLGFLPGSTSDSSGASAPARSLVTKGGTTRVSAQAAAQHGAPKTRVLYENRPIAVLLGRGHERIIELPFVAMIEVPPALDGRLSVQAIENTLYITASEPFETTRVLAQAIDGTAVLPLDITATKSGAQPALSIHLPGNAPADGALATQSVDTAPPAQAMDVVALTRFAAQTLYAPARLVPVLTTVRRDKIDTKELPDLYRGGAIKSEAIASWCSGKLCVTAVKLTNQSTEPLEIDPTAFRGQWLTLQPHTRWLLHPAGSELDTTAAYLVSEGSFAAARAAAR